MAEVNFYFEYRNINRVQLPVKPKKLNIQTPGKNSTVNVVNLGEISILKTPGLQTISFESFIPASNNGTYIQKGATVFEAAFYKDFFETVMNQKEPVNFVVTGLGVNIPVTIESFEYWWDGSDPDMHFKISLKQYRNYTAKITIQNSTTNTTKSTPTSSRANTAKEVTIGCTVRVNGVLYKDSYKTGPGATEKNAIRKVNFIKKGRACPYHVTTLEGGWRGWVTADSVEVI